MRRVATLWVLALALLGFVFRLTLAQDIVQPADWPKQYYAPYTYPGQMPLVKTMEATGIRYFVLAFILAGRDCVATWDGGGRITSMPFLPQEIADLRAAGGDVMVSFGGAGGDELALKCSDFESLIEQYKLVVDTYGLTHLDFDIEGDEIRDPESVDRRSAAIARLQQDAERDGRSLIVSFTLPVMPSGLTSEGLAVLQSALEHGVEINVVNIMTMNFGGGFSPDALGEHTIQAATSLVDQLRDMYPDKTESQLWSMVGLTPMIGLNDVRPEVFTLTDAETVTDFAIQKGLSRLSMWALSRDQSCVSGVEIVSIRCSGIQQDPFAFSKVFVRFNS